MSEILLLYLAFGALAGMLSGLFGNRRGVVIVPFSAWQFSVQGFNNGIIMVTAVATSLATIVVTSLSAVYAHNRRGAVDWSIVGRLSPGILLGARARFHSGRPATRAPVQIHLRLVPVVRQQRAMLFGGKGESGSQWNLNGWLMASAGIAIGLVSAILGIGGGTLKRPFAGEMPLHHAQRRSHLRCLRLSPSQWPEP